MPMRGIVRAALLGGIAAVVLASVLTTPSLQWPDAWAYDWLLRVRHAAGGGPRLPREVPIRIIGIDEAAAAHFDCLSPISRGYLSLVLRKLTEARPRLIVLDVVLDRPTHADEDAALASAIERAGNVVLTYVAFEAGDKGADSILPSFRDGALTLGAVDVSLDRDNVLRRMQVAAPDASDSAPFVAVVAAREVQGGSVVPSAREVLINFAGPLGQAFPILSSQQLLAGSVDRDVLRGAVVFVGVTFKDAGDSVITPLSVSLDQLPTQSRPMAGVETLAHCLLTLLTAPVHELGWFPRAALAGGLGSLAAALVTWLAFVVAARRRLRFAVWVAAVTGLFAAALPGWASLFVWRWTFWGLAPLAAVVLGPTAAAADVAGRDYARKRDAAAELRARQRLTATIVHDLKTPLAAIRVSAATLGHEPGREARAEETRELLDIIERQTERLGHEIESPLDADPKRPIVAWRAPVDLGALVRDVVASQRASTVRHGFAVHVADSLGEVCVDRALLLRAVANLVDNVVRYSPDGGSVEVRVEGDASKVRISVSDQGIGMTPAQQQRLFRPFARVVDERYGIRGAGVGLYSVKRIAEAHGGTVGVESEPGKGLRFWLDLPTAKEARPRKDDRVMQRAYVVALLQLSLGA